MATYKNAETGETKEFMWDSDVYQDATGEVWQKVRVTRGLSAMTEQVGGSHYKDFVIQPIEFIQKNGLSFIEGSVLKYICRWRNKNGIEDLKKARHYLDMLIEMEEKK